MAIEQGGRRVVVNTLDAMSVGRYVVHGEVTAQDGDVVAAEFDFAVATTTVELNGAESGTSIGFPVIALLRWLFFLSLTAKLSGRGETVILQPCGRGCFVGPVSWTGGLEYIELRVYATGWHGGMVSLLIRWAPRISRDALTRVRKVMLAQKAFRVVESITSDTTGHRLLTFGLPAEGIHVELEVDASYRIVHETLAAPNHLAMRTFNYPR